MLTGGRSAEHLMRAWLKHPDFAELHIVDFFFGDERCVLPEDYESNFGLAMRTLFRFGIPKGCVVHRMEADLVDIETAANRYSKLLKDHIDILF